MVTLIQTANVKKNNNAKINYKKVEKSCKTISDKIWALITPKSSQEQEFVVGDQLDPLYAPTAPNLRDEFIEKNSDYDEEEDGDDEQEGGEESKHNSIHDKDSNCELNEKDTDNTSRSKVEDEKNKMFGFVTTLVLASLGDINHLDKLNNKLIDHYKNKEDIEISEYYEKFSDQVVMKMPSKICKEAQDFVYMDSYKINKKMKVYTDL